MALYDVNLPTLGIIGVWAFGLTIFCLYTLIRNIGLKRGWIPTTGAVLRLLLSYLMAQLMETICIAKDFGNEEIVLGWMRTLPLWAMLTGLVVMTLLEMLFLYRLDAELNRTITSRSIKEATDRMPGGILVFMKNGRIILSNLAAGEILKELFGENNERDGNRIWEKVDRESRRMFGEDNETPILMTEDESKAFLFQRKEHEVDGIPLVEVMVHDVTEAYAVSRRLMEENDKLSQQRDRLVELGQLVDNVTREREMLEAKVRIHDDLGSLLIATKRYLTDGGQADRDGLQEVWSTNLSLLQGKVKEQKHDEFAPVLKAAADVGVKVTVNGEFPKEKDVREILALAISETITNTFRHAEGNEIYLTMEEDEKEFRCSLENNGMPPDGPITERGGLKHLRGYVENYGGEMRLEYGPGLILKLSFPKED